MRRVFGRDERSKRFVRKVREERDGFLSRRVDERESEQKSRGWSVGVGSERKKEKRKDDESVVIGWTTGRRGGDVCVDRELRRGAVDEIEANVNDNKNDKEGNEGNESNNQEERKAGDPPPQDKASKSWLNRPLSEWSHREKLKVAGAYVCNVAREDCFVNLGYTLSRGNFLQTKCWRN